MLKPFKTAAALIGALALGPCFAAIEAQAAEVRVISTGAMNEIVKTLSGQFEATSGHRVVVVNDTAGGVARRVAAGEAFDLIVNTPAGVDDMIAKRLMQAGSRVDIARVGVGVAVKEGAAKPDISTVEAFKRALLAAKSVAYRDPASGGTSGIYFDRLLDRLGVGAEVRAKAKLQATGYVAELVAAGEAEIVVQQMSEIVPVRGVTIIGPLPAEIQSITTYSAGLAAAPRDAEAARALLAFLSGPAAPPLLKAVGMEPAAAP